MRLSCRNCRRYVLFREGSRKNPLGPLRTIAGKRGIGPDFLEGQQASCRTAELARDKVALMGEETLNEPILVAEVEGERDARKGRTIRFSVRHGPLAFRCAQRRKSGRMSRLLAHYAAARHDVRRAYRRRSRTIDGTRKLGASSPLRSSVTPPCRWGDAPSRALRRSPRDRRRWRRQAPQPRRAAEARPSVRRESRCLIVRDRLR